MTPTWEQSVQRARKAAGRATAGRFAVAMASFEQVEPFATGPKGDERTVLDFAEDVGMSYHTLACYRSVALWWYESDLDLAPEIGLPEHIAWDGLKWAKSHFVTAGDLRRRLSEAQPSNGAIWSRDDLERIYKRAPYKRVAQSPGTLEAYDRAISLMRRMGDRMTRTLTAVHELDLTDRQREELLAATKRAEAPLTFLVAYLEEGGDDVLEQIDEFLSRERASA